MRVGRRGGWSAEFWVGWEGMRGSQGEEWRWPHQDEGLDSLVQKGIADPT